MVPCAFQWRQCLVVGEDLLDHDPGALAEGLQPLEILLGIGQAVGMVDAQPVHARLARQPADESVNRFEHRLVLGAQRGEIGNLEETPVVDLVGSNAPEREPVVLLLEEAVQVRADPSWSRGCGCFLGSGKLWS